MEKDYLEILLEDIRGKFDLVLEGHDLLRKEIRDTREELCEKIEFLDFKIDAVHDKLDRKIDAVHDKLDRKIDAFHDKLDQKIDAVGAELGRKIDAVAADLAAHRADTEAHPLLFSVQEK